MSNVKAISTAIEKSAKTLATTNTTLAKTMTELAAVLATVDSTVEQVQEAQAKLDGINDETKLKVRDAKVELDMQVKENENKVLDTLMKARGLAVITSVDLTALEARLQRDEETAKADIAKAVNAALANAKSAAELEMLKAQSEWKEAKATLIADANTATQKVEFLETQVKQLQDTIAAERQARIDIAEADSKKAGVTINQGK